MLYTGSMMIRSDDGLCMSMKASSTYRDPSHSSNSKANGCGEHPESRPFQAEPPLLIDSSICVRRRSPSVFRTYDLALSANARTLLPKKTSQNTSLGIFLL